MKDIVLPRSTAGSRSMHGWLFPVLVPDPRRASERMLRAGFDAPRGMTQLGPVAADEGDDDAGGCRRTRAVFDRILYLPVTNQMSSEEQSRFVKALRDVSSPPDSAKSDLHQEDCLDELQEKGSSRKSRRRRLVAFSVCAMEWQFSMLGLFQYLPLRISIRLWSL